MNINSVWNKFKNMSNLVSEYVDILIVADNKQGHIFQRLFLIPGLHHPFRLDINRQIGCLLVCIKGSIPASLC